MNEFGTAAMPQRAVVAPSIARPSAPQAAIVAPARLDDRRVTVLIPAGDRPAVASTGIPGSARQGLMPEPADAVVETSPVRVGPLPLPERLPTPVPSTMIMGAGARYPQAD